MTSWEGALKRRFHLQDIHCVEFSKGTKRSPPDAAAEDTRTSVNYRGKRRCVNQTGPKPDKALLPTTGYHFIDETVETIKSRPFSPVPLGETVVQKNSQRVTSPGLTISDDGSSSTSATCLSTRGTEDRSPSTPFADLCPESFDSLLDPGLLSSDNSTSQFPSPSSSDNVNTPQVDDEDEFELPSLHSLLNIGPSSSPPGLCNTLTEKGLAEPTLQIQGWEEVPGPDGAPILQELSDHELDAQGPGVFNVRDERRPTAFALRNKSVVASGNGSIPKQSSHRTNICPRCGAAVPHSPKRRRKPLNTREQRAFCEAHERNDKLQSAETEWTRCGYPRIGWRKLDARLQKFSPAFRDILEGVTPSFYCSELESAVASRVKPQYRGMEFSTAGYYGSRGQQIM
jgi:hypothetical protein